MRLQLKIVVAALAAIIAFGSMSAPASAQQPPQQQRQGVGIWPLFAGPLGMAFIGSSTTTAFWSTAVTKKLFFYKYNWFKWGKVYHLHKAGYDIKINKIGKKFVKVKGTKTTHHSQPDSNNMTQGKAIVGCIMGSAFGAISAAIRKGNALGNPLRWRSQAEHERIVASGYEKQFELTNDEAWTAVAFCGLGSLTLRWQ